MGYPHNYLIYNKPKPNWRNNLSDFQFLLCSYSSNRKRGTHFLFSPFFPLTMTIECGQRFPTEAEDIF